MSYDTKPSLADIVYNQKEKAIPDKHRPKHVKDELDEPKHKISNPLLFAKTREVLGNIISKRMKTSGGTDIDWLIEHNGGFMIFELKIFHDDRILVSKAQMIAYEKLYENLPKCHVLFIGHDDINFSDLNDSVWLFEMREWKTKAIPHVEDSLVDPSYSENEVFGYRIEREFMEKIDVMELRNKIDSIWNEFER
ncbi:MAG TPA: hypothetical protein VJ771_04985 [Candidatus Nitrosotalea sp.]|nr:hypothetical protein [Candidatus Nitrosotalea sp.]